MRNTYALALVELIDHPWAIQPAALEWICDVLAHGAAGHPDAEALASALNRKNLPQPKGGSVAVIPLHGVLTPRANWLSDFFGGTSYQALSSSLATAMADPSIKTIVFDVDSPGGSVAGATEFAAEVRAARKVKPIIAQVSYTMASAAAWVMSGATSIVASPSARVGAVGVYTAHDDMSEAFAKEGVKRTYISAGVGKVDGNPAEPLSGAPLARIQAAIDEAYAMFVGDVVKGRGGDVTADLVTKKWQAHVYGAADAKTLNLIDRIGTLDETVAGAMLPNAGPRAMSAADRALEQALFDSTYSLT